MPEALPVDACVTKDPEFTGPFPLTGVSCRVVAVRAAEDRAHLGLRFVDLPRGLETANLDRICAPTCLVFGVAFVLIGMAPNPAARPPSPGYALLGGLWLGLGLSSLVRYVHGRDVD